MFPLSEKYMLPLESTVIPFGTFIFALIAALPSPLLPSEPVPAIVVMMPVDTVTYKDTQVYKIW